MATFQAFGQASAIVVRCGPPLCSPWRLFRLSWGPDRAGLGLFWAVMPFRRLLSALARQPRAATHVASTDSLRPHHNDSQKRAGCGRVRKVRAAFGFGAGAVGFWAALRYSGSLGLVWFGNVVRFRRVS